MGYNISLEENGSSVVSELMFTENSSTQNP